MTELTRRQFVAAGAASVAALAVPARPTREPATDRVIVVGAGLAGMTAALDLVAAGRPVVVLEARSRVGGRVFTHHFDDTMHAELGGESIDDNHTAMAAMLERFGIGTEDRPIQKPYDSTVYYEGSREVVATFLARHAGQVATDYLGFFDSLDAKSKGVDPLHPERAANADELDALDLGSFIDSLGLVPEAEFLVRLEFRGEYNAEPEDLSMLFIAQQNNGESPSMFGVERQRIVGGNSTLTAAMAAELGSIIRLGAPVDRIRLGDDGVTVTSGATSFDGSHVIIAAPLMAMRDVTFTPALPSTAAALIGGLDLGPAAKVVNEYSARFWTPTSPSGFTLTDLPFHIAWSSSDSYVSVPGLLSQFITGDGAELAASLDDGPRVATFGAMLDEVFPEGKPLRTGRTATQAWAREPYTGGGYAIFRPGQMKPFWPVLRSGVGRVRFAGEHTEVLAGYMESAIRSGHRVVAEVVADEPTASSSEAPGPSPGPAAQLPATGLRANLPAGAAVAAALALFTARAARRDR